VAGANGAHVEVRLKGNDDDQTYNQVDFGQKEEMQVSGLWGLETVSLLMRNSGLRWFGHVEHKLDAN